MALIGILASTTMFACVVLTIAGHGVQGLPNGAIPGEDEIVLTVWAPEGTTFVQGMNALLGIVYTWVGHALIPSFVGDMSQPEHFPKALALSMLAEFVLFTCTGAIVYSYAYVSLSIFCCITLPELTWALLQRSILDRAGLRLPHLQVRQGCSGSHTPYYSQ